MNITKRDIIDVICFAAFMIITLTVDDKVDLFTEKYLFPVGILVSLYFLVLFIMGMGVMQRHNGKSKDE